ncbi:pseudouridine synthase [Marinithermus hydrothermalis]|uniref:Pseudouridine synthase n=1 Tax=Marinithermus hydrothermalis (strain DSM 14884 / JCM 11576 / T1) TaxID=869210 RepID=F2NN74_MARHT|nr:pseudouridine synthase [Marinithermus hydrothermalis]AEB12813.1 pseudouridine synthase Rsu [Marinithermus hydrothermalis DSM 14884]
MEAIRLQKYLAQAGVASSRRKAEALIRAGRVTINGQVAALGAKVTPGDEVCVDGRPVAPTARRVVLALHKPPGVTTTRRDRFAERTVFELVPAIPGLHTVGRLDRDSEGLLLLTNDGRLTQRLTHPRYGVPKVYRVWTAKGEVPPFILKRLEKGVRLEDGPARALKARPKVGGCVLTLAEGRKREVRRMLRAVGYPVVRLLRVKIGPIRLGGLKPGAWREIEGEELEGLYRAAGLSVPPR